MEQTVNILGFAGSLRLASFNRALLRAAQDVLPDSATLEIYDLDGFPGFNDDLLASPPAKVKEFKAKIKAAAALLIATPEYNYSFPGVLKNAIDWASRPPTDNAFDGKPVAIMSASTGMLGGARAQYHLRQTFVFLKMHPLNRPEVFVTFAGEKFDNQGHLLDDKARSLLKELLEALVAWTRKLKGA